MRYVKDAAGLMRIRYILAVALALLPLLANAGIYKWRDADGTVIYSQIPPADGRTVEQMKGARPPAEAPEKARQELEKLQQRLKEMRESRESASQDSDKQAEKEQAQRSNCRAARANLQKLETRNHPLVSDGRGGMRHMTSTERQQKLEQYREDIKVFCR